MQKCTLPGIGRLIRPLSSLAKTKHETLTLQHKIENILGPVYGVGERQSDLSRTTREANFWKDVLADTFENLSIGAERPARVVVLGMDQWAGAEDLVTALLEEPLSSDATQAEKLQNRWTDSSASSLTISPKASASVQLSSAYLSQFSIPLEITELRASDNSIPPSLFKADVPIVVFNPLTIPFSTLKTLTFPSNTIFIASSPPSLNSTTLPQELLPSPPKSLYFIDSSLALNAVQTFRTNPNSPLAIQQYQDNFTNSGISHITNLIRSTVDTGLNSPSSFEFLRNKTALVQLHDALDAFHTNLKSVQRSLDDIREGISRLIGRVEEVKARAHGEILGHGTTSSSQVEGKGKDQVGDSLRLASKEMKLVLERLTWWKTVWRVDEISTIVGDAVNRVWCRDLEQKLILQTGRLHSLQNTLTTAAQTLVSLQTPQLIPSTSLTPPPSSPSDPTTPPLFTANILKNTLSQITSSLTYTLTPSTLISPISKRKIQLLTYPTTRLHLAAQHTVIGMGVGIASGSGITWAGWVGYLMQNASTVGTGIWDMVGMGAEPTTGIAIGLLGVVGSIRWAMAKWEKAKRKWWSDWERVGQGLERDLKIKVDEVMTQKVTIGAEKACEGLEELVKSKQEEVDRVINELRKLKNELEVVVSKRNS